MRWFVLPFVLYVTAQTGLAQASKLRGVVVDSTGAAIPGASVEVRRDSKIVVNERVDRLGAFLFDGLPGTYSVQISARGFANYLQADEVFAESQIARLVLNFDPNGGGYSGPCCFNSDNGVKSTEVHVETSIRSGLMPTFVVPALVESSVRSAAKADWEYGAFFQGGVGLEDRTNFSFLSAGVQLGKILTPELGSGVLKGTIEYAVQVLPYWQSSTPKFPVLKCPAGATAAAQCYGPVTAGGTYRGASIEPIILRYNLTHGKRLMPWVQAAGGVVYTTRKYPAVGNTNYLDPTQTGPAADTSVWNFTPQGGVGAHYFLSPRRSVDFSANGVHISSASLGDKNPGVNVSLQMSVGVTWWSYKGSR